MTRPDFLLLLALLAFAPLAFGTVEPWSLAVLESGAFAALAVAARRRTFDGALRLPAVPGALPLLGFLALLLLQAVPLPPGLVRALSPAAHAAWTATLGSAGPLPWVTLSLAPVETARELLRFAAYAAVYVLGVHLLSRRERLQAAGTFLAVFAALLGFLALVQSAAAPTRLLLLRPAPPDATPFGPFVNRNHFADLMAMLTPFLVGLFLMQRPPGAARDLRDRLASLLARPEASARLMLGLATLLAATSLVVSLSRGAMIAVSAALLLLGAGLLARGVGARRVVALVLLAGTFALFTGWFGWERVAARFATARQAPGFVDHMRPVAWRDTLRMARDFPLLGSGVGAFERVYPRYRSVPGVEVLTHAHSDWLELLAGGGAAGFLLFAWFVGAAVRSALLALRERRDAAARYLGLGAVAAVTAFLVHGASDFSLALGANGLYFFFFLAVAVAASHSGGEDGRSRLPRAALPAACTAAALVVALAVPLGWACSLAARHAWTVAGEQTALASGLRAPPGNARELFAWAARLDPLEPRYQAALGRMAARDGDAGAALRHTAAALRRSPADPAVLRQLALLLVARGETDAARRAFQAAVAYGALDPLNHLAFGSWLAARGERDAAVSRLRAALAVDPARVPQVMALLAVSGWSEAEAAAAIPEEPEALLRYARHLEATGSEPAAAGAYRRALRLAPGDPRALEGLRRLEARPGARPSD
jgi:O-antigen ligase